MKIWGEKGAKNMKRARGAKTAMLAAIFLCLGGEIHAAWVMFSDKDDTYIYNNVSGDIYVRFKKGGANYEDVFVKMPSGVVPKKRDSGDFVESKSEKKPQENTQELLLDKIQNIQQSTLNRVLE